MASPAAQGAPASPPGGRGLVTLLALVVVACAPALAAGGPDAPWVVVMDDVRVSVDPPVSSLPGSSPRALHVSGARATWDLKRNTGIFEGDVAGRRGEVSLRCHRLEVVAGPDGGLKQATATGEVRVVKGARIATGARAVMDVAAGRVEVTGSPVLTDGASRLAGSRIVLYLDEDRLECHDCELVLEPR